MQNLFVGESALQPAYQQIVEFPATQRKSCNVDFDDSDYGRPFMYYLFFARQSPVGQILGVALTEEETFYSAYYWFQRFVGLYMRKHGYDAGLEQQAFKMLEEAKFDLDFEVVEMLDKKAKE